MNDQILTFTAEPPATRWTYVKTTMILLVAAEIMNVFAQMRLVQRLELKFSSIIVAVITLLIAYFLSRSPLTQSLTIDYARRLVIVGFATLTKAQASLEIPFDRLGVITDAPAAAGDSNAKWKTKLLLDGREVYLFLSSENGFRPEQLTEFNDRVREAGKTS